MPPKRRKKKEFKLVTSNVNARTNEGVDEADDETSFVLESGAAEISLTTSKTSGIEIPIEGQDESQQERIPSEARLLPSARQHEENTEGEEASAVNNVKSIVKPNRKQKGYENVVKDKVSPIIIHQKDDSQPIEEVNMGQEGTSSTILVTSQSEEELTVTKKFEVTTKFVVAGAVVGESHTDTDAPGNGQAENPEQVSSALGREEERDGKVAEEKAMVSPDQDDTSQYANDERQGDVLPIRNLQPGFPIDQNTDENLTVAAAVPEEAMPNDDEGTTNQGGRRNLVPGGAEDGIEGDNSEFTKPPDKHEDTSVRDLNENAVVEEETLAGKAAINMDDDNELPWAMYRNIEKTDRPSDAEDEFSADDEGTFDGPPGTSNIPELYEYLGSLDNGDTELESKGIPPSLYDNDQHRNTQQNVEDTKLAMAEEEIGWYLQEFEKYVEEEVLMIGNISLSEVQEEERHIRDEHTAYQKVQAQIQKDKHRELAAAMEKAKKHVLEVFREKYGKVKNKEAALMRRDRRIQGQISKAFRRSENQLLKALRKRKAEVMAMYGDLVFADQEFGGGRGKRWKVDWDKTHQPIQIKLKCLRSVRDKLPLGEYVLMVSLYSRLGGHVMKWSNLRGQQWGAATLPLWHDGEFYNTELKIDQSVFTVCPSKPDMRPGMVLMFELFILSGPFTAIDKVVAWGCFPICDGVFNVVEGKYKTPLIRGVIDQSITMFQTMEEMIAHDLEYWLCNMYFEIIKLPRYLMGQKEYEVELQFTSGMVSYPIRTKTGEDFVDGEQPVYGSTTDFGSIAASRVSMPNSRANSFFSVRSGATGTKAGGGPIKLTVDPPKRKISRPGSSISMSMKLQKAADISTELKQRRTSNTSVSLQPADDPPSRKLSATGSRRSYGGRSMALTDDSDSASGTDYDDDDVCIVKKDLGFRRVKGHDGMYFKVHQNNPVDVYNRKLMNTMPQKFQASGGKKKKKLTHQDELRQHTYNVKTLWTEKGHLPRRGREKLQYIMRMMLAELGLSQWRKGQFWITLFMLLMTWFMRMYLHYFGQWVLLKALSVPINKFNFHPHTVELNYQATLLQARHEIGIVMMGPITNFLFFLLFVPLTMLFQRFFRWFPDVITLFILAFGIQTFFDPLWILIVDVALGRQIDTGGNKPIGDAFKLYWHFNRNYSNSAITLYVSISMTVFLYIVAAFSVGALWYMFFIRLHNNGRMMDVYWRLHGTEEEFFLPYDLEVSNEELNYLCHKAEQWRGEEGERRKVAVYDYVWEQEELIDEQWDNPSAHGRKTGAREVTTHVSIHTIHQDGLIELYRQFLRLPDGAVVEVFGEMNMPGIDEGVKEALLQKTGFKGVSNTVKRNRSLSVSSFGRNTRRRSSAKPMTSNRLDVPV